MENEDDEFEKKVITSVLNTSVGSVIDEASLSKILVTNLIPSFIVNRYHKLRIDRQEAKALETAFSEYTNYMEKTLKFYFEKLVSTDISESVDAEEKIKNIESRINSYKVVKLIFKKLIDNKNTPEDVLRILTLSDSKEKFFDKKIYQENLTDNSKKEELFNQDTAESWFNIFQQICERRCEPWRQEILSEAYLQERKEPNSVSLKTLWEIGLINTFTFESFIGFLNSSVYLEDDYPIVFYDHKNDDSFMHKFVEIDDLRVAKLFNIINHLEENGLIMHGSVLFSSDKPISGFSKNHQFQIIHSPEIKDTTGTELKFTGYHCTDLGLSIYNICTNSIKLNDLSNESYDELKDLLNNYQDTIKFIEVD